MGNYKIKYEKREKFGFFKRNSTSNFGLETVQKPVKLPPTKQKHFRHQSVEPLGRNHH
jgi:hypothetical protein